MNEELNEQNEPEAVDELAELDELLEADFEPAKSDAEQAEEKIKRDQANMTAFAAVGMLEAGISLTAPKVQIEQEHKVRVAEKLGAVLYKYEMTGLPAWLIAYREELEFAGALGLMTLAIAAQVRASREVENGEKSESQTTE